MPCQAGLAHQQQLQQLKDETLAENAFLLATRRFFRRSMMLLGLGWGGPCCANMNRQSLDHAIPCVIWPSMTQAELEELRKGSAARCAEFQPKDRNRSKSQIHQMSPDVTRCHLMEWAFVQATQSSEDAEKQGWQQTQHFCVCVSCSASQIAKSRPKQWNEWNVNHRQLKALHDLENERDFACTVQTQTTSH